jgi:hypothetical protein
MIKAETPRGMSIGSSADYPTVATVFGEPEAGDFVPWQRETGVFAVQACNRAVLALHRVAA